MHKKLTDYADCAGCASKLGAAELEALMDDLPRQTDERIIVDYSTADDAGVYRWGNGRSLCRRLISSRRSSTTRICSGRLPPPTR